jgi:hypothetical protein
MVHHHHHHHHHHRHHHHHHSTQVTTARFQQGVNVVVDVKTNITATGNAKSPIGSAIKMTAVI